MIQRNVPGHARADVAAPVLERRDVRLHARRADRERRGEREHDARVAEREEEADPERTLLLLQELARRVVDRRDVVGVERVAQPEGVRKRAEPGERRVRAREEQEEAPAERCGGARPRRRSRRGEATRRGRGRGSSGASGYLTFGSAWTVIATPATTMTTAETAGKDAQRETVEAAPGERRAREDGDEADPGDREREPERERDDQDEAERDPVERDRGEQHDERRRARQRAAGDADREQAAEPGSRLRRMAMVMAVVVVTWPWRCARSCSQSRKPRAENGGADHDDGDARRSH